MVIPCLVFGIVFSLVVIFICWRCHKQIIYQAGEAASTPLVPVIGKPLVSFLGIFRAWPQLFTANGFSCFQRGLAIKIRKNGLKILPGFLKNISGFTSKNPTKTPKNQSKNPVILKRLGNLW